MRVTQWSRAGLRANAEQTEGPTAPADFRAVLRFVSLRFGKFGTLAARRETAPACRGCRGITWEGSRRGWDYVRARARDRSNGGKTKISLRKISVQSLCTSAGVHLRRVRRQQAEARAVSSFRSSSSAPPESCTRPGRRGANTGGAAGRKEAAAGGGGAAGPAAVSAAFGQERRGPPRPVEQRGAPAQVDESPGSARGAGRRREPQTGGAAVRRTPRRVSPHFRRFARPFVCSFCASCSRLRRPQARAKRARDDPEPAPKSAAARSAKRARDDPEPAPKRPAVPQAEG